MFKTRIFIILGILLLIIPIINPYSYFFYKLRDNYVLICPNCSNWVSCQSDSMRPTFDCSDTLIAVEPSSRKEIKSGDIISYRGTKEQLGRFGNESVKYVIHRIYKINSKGCYITKGDANHILDDFEPCFYDIKFKIVGIMYN